MVRKSREKLLPAHKVPLLRNERLYIGEDGEGLKAWFGRKPETETNLMAAGVTERDWYAVYTS